MNTSKIKSGRLEFANVEETHVRLLSTDIPVVQSDFDEAIQNHQDWSDRGNIKWISAMVGDIGRRRFPQGLRR